MKKILIVEDDRVLNEGIKFVLQKENYQIKQVYNIEEASKVINDSIDLILLDINLPDGDGIEFCIKVRKEFSVNIIFISANDTDNTIIKALELGGDDYITKPFSLMVLRAKVEALLRRSENTDTENLYQDDVYYFDFENMTYLKNDKSIILSNTEQKILKLLVCNRGKILSKEKLLNFVWGVDAAYIEENALIVGIKRLRTKLEDSPKKPTSIVNIYGVGYTWEYKKIYE